MNELALFAGAGGGILGGKLLGWKTVCAVEWDPYCQAVLLARQADGLLEQFPIWGDIRTFDGTPMRGFVDVVSAGFPCQPFSTAGKRQGEADERNMWPDTIRVIREVGPEWCLLENVPGLVTSGYFGTILRDLAKAGFDAEWDVFSAAGEGAPHLRERLWIVAHAGCLSEHGLQSNRFAGSSKEAAPGRSGKELADSKGDRWGKGRTQQAEFGRDPGLEHGGSIVGNPDRSGQPESEGRSTSARAHGSGPALYAGGFWPSGRGEPQKEWEPPRTVGLKSSVGGGANGLAHRVDRLKALGNGQVPSVATRAWLELSGRF